MFVHRVLLELSYFFFFFFELSYFFSLHFHDFLFFFFFFFFFLSCRCRDSQTSADAQIGGEATGAMSWAFRLAYDEGDPNQSYVALLTRIRALLTKKYSQVPQMSSGRKLDLEKAEFKA
jgi:hypothetical protein